MYSCRNVSEMGPCVYCQEDLGRIVDCEEPDKMTAEERRAARMQAEEEKFDEDHYMYGSMALMGEGVENGGL